MVSTYFNFWETAEVFSVNYDVKLTTLCPEACPGSSLLRAVTT